MFLVHVTLALFTSRLASAGLATAQPTASGSWDPVLTPWWDLTFAEGEQLVVDCGAYTGSDPPSVGISWFGPNGEQQPIHDRVQLSRRDKNKADDTEAGAYSVLTFTLHNLTISDSGVYTCAVEKSINGKNETKTANLTLTVLDSKSRCGFESDTLCGWTIDVSSDVRWHVHDGRDEDVINRTKGTHFDHTYGASKDIGRFLDVDVQHYDGVIDHNVSAKLISPVYKAHTQYKCLQFWYIFEGRDQTHLKVSVSHLNDSNKAVSDLWKIEKNQNNGWQLTSVNIPPQKEDYHLLIDASVCFDRCSLAASAVDDVMITDGKCQNTTDWPDNSLRVRLVGGSSPKEGQVEVLHDGQWGTVCSDQFGQKEAKVICRSLGYGYEYAERRRNAHFSSNNSELRSMVWLERLACTGKETDLAQCIAKGESWAQTDCTHKEDAGVICSDTPLPSSTKANRSPTTKVAPPADVLSTLRSNTVLSTSMTTTAGPVPKQLAASTTTVSTSTTTAAADTTKRPTQAVHSTTSKSTTTVTTTTTAKSTTLSTTTTETTSKAKTVAPPMRTTTLVTSSTGRHYVTPTTHRAKPLMSSTGPTKTTTTKLASNNPDIVSLPPEVEAYTTGSNAGVAIGIIFAVLIATTGVGILLYRRRRKAKKSTYITFGNPSYSREHLPANDFSLESPLTLSSNGYTVLA